MGDGEGQTRLLVVEDESIVALDIRRRLESMGYEVVGIASTGEAAYESAIAERPDLILMDIKLQGPVDGIEAAERIRHEADIPIIFMTAFADQRTFDRAKGTHAFGYILKPFQEREVLISIEMALYKHRADKELRESRAWLSGILHSIAEGLIAVDTEGRIVFANRRAIGFLGVPEPQIRGAALAELASFRDSPALSVMAPAIPVSGEYRMRWTFLDSAAGTWPVELIETPIFEDSSELAGRLLVIRDLTEVLAVVSQKERLSSIVAAANDAVITMDRSFVIGSWNFGAELMYGYAAEEIVGHSLLDLMPDAATKRQFADLAHLVDSGNGRGGHFESLRRCRSGKIVSVSLALFPLTDATGRTVELASVERDVSAEKEYQASLIAAKHAAEEASRAKSEFLSNMSHELRTPLNSILGMTELATELSTREDQREYLGIAHQSASDLLFLINSILDFSKMEVGKMGVSSMPFDPIEAAEDCMEAVTVPAARKGIDLFLRAAPTLPSTVVGDHYKYKQILMNLLSNAVKFTDRGHVRLDVEADPDRQLLVLRVSDTGIGIPATKLAVIWDPFTQADGSSTRAYGGTGLGLSIVRSLAELLGGTVSVESVEREGSVFTVTLPLVEGPTLTSPSLPPQRRRIGLLLDGPESTSIIGELLESWDQEVIVVPDEPELLATLDKPDRGGFSAFLVDDRRVRRSFLHECEALSACSEGSSVDVVLLSDVLGRNDQEWRALARSIQVIVRPVRRSALKAALFGGARTLPGSDEASGIEGPFADAETLADAERRGYGTGSPGSSGSTRDEGPASVAADSEGRSKTGSGAGESAGSGAPVAADLSLPDRHSAEALRDFVFHVERQGPAYLRTVENEATMLRSDFGSSCPDYVLKILLRLVLAARRGDEAEVAIEMDAVRDISRRALDDAEGS